MTKHYRSGTMAVIQETAESLHAAAVTGKQTMRQFDEARLTPMKHKRRFDGLL